MTTKRTLAALFLMLFMLLTACSPQPGEPSAPVDEPEASYSPAVTGLSFSVDALAQLVGAEADDSISVLDATEEAILFSVTHYYQDGEENYTEEGYSGYTKALVLYDLEEAQATRYDLADTVYCSDGAISGESFVCVLLTLDGLRAEYSLQYWENGTPAELRTGACFAGDYTEPQIESLGNGAYAFGSLNEEDNSVGVEILNGEKTFRTAFSYEQLGATEYRRNDLFGDGARFLYHLSVDGVETIYIGDASGVISQFALEPDDRLYSCALFEETVVLSLFQGTGSTMMVVKNFQGETLSQKGQKALYRLVSDGKGHLMGIDDGYHVYLVSPEEDDSLSVTMTDCPNKPVRFYALGPGAFLLNYYSQTSPGFECLFSYVADA